MSATARLDIVLVNWNSRDLLRTCVASLADSEEPSRLNVVVVDNASTDGSAENLPSASLHVQVIRNGENRGFGAACNQGAAAGHAPFILFLNPDTQVGPDTLGLALSYLQEHSGAGVLGVRQTDESGTTLRTCARIPNRAGLLGQTIGLDRLGLVPPHFMTEWDHEDTRAVGQVMGAFLMIRRELFERLGGFDERFFVYFEDLDLCARAAAAGSPVVHFAGATIRHQTQGTTAQVKDRRLFYFLRSGALYAAKHHGAGSGLLYLLAGLLIQIPMRLARALAGRRPDEAWAVLRAARMLAGEFPRLLPRLREASILRKDL